MKLGREILRHRKARKSLKWHIVMLLSDLESYHDYMAHKARSNFIEAEKEILKTTKELEDENTFDVETVGYVWCLHGEVYGDLKQFDRLRESFSVALKKQIIRLLLDCITFAHSSITR